MIRSLIFPFDKYWFINVYILLYVSSPVLNAGIEAINKKWVFLLVAIFTIFFCLLGFVSEGEASILGLNSGYSFIFAVYLYFMGRMMHKHNLWKLPQKLQIMAWLSTTCLTIAGCATMILIEKLDVAWKLFSYNQIFIVGASINFLWIFLNMSKGCRIIWQTLAKHTLPIYYIHTSAVFSYYRNQPLQKAAESISWIMQIIFLISYAIVIFVLCYGVDKMKQTVFKNIENKIIDKIMKVLEHGLGLLVKS